MEVELKPETEQLLHQKFASGQYESLGQLIDEALRVLDAQELRKRKALAELKAAVAVGIADVDAGNIVPYDMKRFRDEAAGL